MSDHWVEIEFDGDYSPSSILRCEAQANALCHARYSCSCESWYTEGRRRDGKPFHIVEFEPFEDEPAMHVGEWVNECRYEEWFDNSDEPLIGRVKVDVEPDWNGDYYLFSIGDKDARD